MICKRTVILCWLSCTLLLEIEFSMSLNDDVVLIFLYINQYF
jgi:hypothetical protein